MTKFSFFFRPVFLVLALSLYVPSVFPQNASEAETKAAAAVESAKDLNSKIAAASAFIKKYPKSTLTARVAQHIMQQTLQVADATEKAKFVGEMQTLFQDTDQSSTVTSAAITAYIAANKPDEAFALGQKALGTNPEDINVLAQLTGASADAVKKQNGKFVTVGIGYGAKAIDLIEAKKKPLSMSEAEWNNHVKNLPQLYQDVGILYLVSKDLPKAKAVYERAIALAPENPMNYAMLASVLDEEYILAATAYQKAQDREKAALLAKANQQLDLVIEAYAKAVAMATGKPEYQPLANQARQNLEPYYKYRNNNSIEGLEKLIEKYKPATP